ncbi:MAG: hypothetical protein WC824_11530 [Bacteroidota bacterium]
MIEEARLIEMAANNIEYLNPGDLRAALLVLKSYRKNLLVTFNEEGQKALKELRRELDRVENLLKTRLEALEKEVAN